MNNEELTTCIKSAQYGNQEAFSFLYDAYSERLFRFIRYRIADYQHCEDVLQEVFVKIWKGLPSYDSALGSFTTWAYRIAINTVNDYLRKRYRQPEPAELADDLTIFTDDTPSHTLDTEIALDSIKEYFTQLPPQYQTILDLRFMQELTVEEAAQALAKTAVSVRVLQHRALKRLKKILDDHDVSK